jgi:carbonic anhydrase
MSTSNETADRAYAGRRPVHVGVCVAATAILSLGLPLLWTANAGDQVTDRPAPTDPNAVLAELRAGNRRFVTSHRTLTSDTKSDADLRRRLVSGQHPLAAVLCCSDSRLCPAFIFDQPPGRLFEIRNAGNVVEDDALASFEYAIEHLHVRFLLVLGHKGCGAVAAVVTAGDKPLHDHLKDLQQRMKGTHAQAIAAHDKPTADFLIDLAKKNALEQATTLVRDSEPIRAAARRGEVLVKAGLYDMESGEVVYYDLP